MKNNSFLKIIGFVLLFVGLGLTAFGLYDYITALIGKLTPRYFWCAGLGLPVLGLGCGFAFFSGKLQPPKQTDDEKRNDEKTDDKPND